MNPDGPVKVKVLSIEFQPTARTARIMVLVEAGNNSVIVPLHADIEEAVLLVKAMLAMEDDDATL